MDYRKMSNTAETAKKWGIGERRVRVLCQKKRVRGAKKIGGMYFIPKNAEKPDDLRNYQRSHVPKDIFQRLDVYKDQLKSAEEQHTNHAEYLLKECEFQLFFIYETLLFEGWEICLEGFVLLLDPEYQGATLEYKKNKEFVSRYLKTLKLIQAENNLSLEFIESICFGLNIDPLAYYRNRSSGERTIPQQLNQMILSHKFKKQHLIEKAALFYLRFLQLWPLKEKNFSIAQFLLNFLLVQAGFPMINILADEKHEKYLRAYLENNNESLMVDYVARLVLRRLKEKKAYFLGLK